MAKFVSVFISATYRRMIAALVWALIFVGLVGLGCGFALHRVASLVEEESVHATAQFTQLRTNLLETFDLMHARVTATPCSPAFVDQMRHIAYLPDGLNEFLYAPGGVARCSVGASAFEQPVDLGAPDIAGGEGHSISLWIDRDLDFLGLKGEKGTFALSEPFVAVVPPQRVNLRPPEWMSMQLVIRAADGQWFHREGEEGVYERGLADPGFSGLAAGTIRTLACDPGGVHCVASEANLLALVQSAAVAIALLLLAAGVIAAWEATASSA